MTSPVTFIKLCDEAIYKALHEYWPYLDPKSQGFLYHMTQEPYRSLSPGQVDWLAELIRRAQTQKRINRGECVLPTSLDEVLAHPASLPVIANDNFDHLEDLLEERGFRIKAS